MIYPFPNVGNQCLLCGRARCSRWKGYYVRGVVCTLLGYAGPIAIHLAQCRTRGVDYTYWPDILVPYLRPSIPTLKLLYETWASTRFSIRAAIDEVTGQIEEEFFLPVAVAYEWLKRISQGLILRHEVLRVRAPESIGASALRGYQSADVRPIFEAELLWRAREPIVFSPP